VEKLSKGIESSILLIAATSPVSSNPKGRPQSLRARHLRGHGRRASGGKRAREASSSNKVSSPSISIKAKGPKSEKGGREEEGGREGEECFCFWRWECRKPIRPRPLPLLVAGERLREEEKGEEEEEEKEEEEEAEEAEEEGVGEVDWMIGMTCEVAAPAVPAAGEKACSSVLPFLRLPLLVPSLPSLPPSFFFPAVVGLNRCTGIRSKRKRRASR